MTFLKKHALKFFILLSVVLILFLLWYHLFPVKIPLDHTVYAQDGGKEITVKGEIQYYRSFSRNGGKVYGEVTFDGVTYGLPMGGPYMFSLYDLGVQADLLHRDKITINFNGKDYKDFFIMENPYPFDIGYNYFLTKPNVNTVEPEIQEPEPEIIEYNYEVTARTVNEIFGISPEKQAEEFISALCLGDKDVVEIYIGGAIDRFETVKMDAYIKNAQVSENDEVVLYANVGLNVYESESPAFPKGEHEYVLHILESPYLNVVSFFGSADTLMNNLSVPTSEISDNEKVNDAFGFVRRNAIALGFIDEIPDIRKHNEESIFHLAQHTCLTLASYGYEFLEYDVFLKYLSDRFGIEDINSYPLIKKELNARKTNIEGKTYYNMSCGHGAMSTVHQFEKYEKEGNVYKISFIFYSDYASISPAKRVVYLFEEDEDCDILRFIGIETEKISDEKIASYLF